MAQYSDWQQTRRDRLLEDTHVDYDAKLTQEQKLPHFNLELNQDPALGFARKPRTICLRHAVASPPAALQELCSVGRRLKSHHQVRTLQMPKFQAMLGMLGGATD